MNLKRAVTCRVTRILQVVDEGLLISPDEFSALATVLMAPMTTKGFALPRRIACKFQGKNGLILLDQIRAVDKSRLVKKAGTIGAKTQLALCSCLQELFAF